MVIELPSVLVASWDLLEQRQIGVEMSSNLVTRS